MKISSNRPARQTMLMSLLLAGAFGCAPEVEIGPSGGGGAPWAAADSTSAASINGPATITSVYSATSGYGATTSGSGGAGGSSPAPACRVTTLAAGLVFPRTITLHGDTLYVTTVDPQGAAPGTGLVVSVPLAGGDPVVLATGQGAALGIAADDAFVYWTSDDRTVKKTPVGGGPITVIARGLSSSRAIAVDASSVYWNDGGAVMKAPVAGGAATVLFPGSADVVSINELAVDAANVFWGGAGPLGGQAAVMMAPIDGGAPRTLVSGLIGEPVFQVDSGNLYNAELVADASYEDQVVLKRPLDGSAPPLTIAQGRSTPNVLAAKGDTVYWAGGTLDTLSTLTYPDPVLRMPSAGGLEETIVSASVTFGMVLCPGGVCWVDASAGTVMRYEACSM